MCTWIDEVPAEPIINSIINDLVYAHLEKEQEKAEVALREVIDWDAHDRAIIRAYTTGKLHASDEQLKNLLRWEYETVYAGPNFVRVRRKIKRDKNNG